MRTRFFSTIWVALAVGAACALAGCAGGGSSASNSLASSSFASMGGGGPTVAFESIDGPPPQVFARLVSLLDFESRSRNVSIVSRETLAAYRVRSYLSAQVSRGRTTIAWVWDVYDRDGQRALRLSGEEAAAKSGRSRSVQDAWTVADDGVLRRIAQSGLAGLNGLTAGSAPAESQPRPVLPRGDGPAVADAENAPTNVALGFSAN